MLRLKSAPTEPFWLDILPAQTKRTGTGKRAKTVVIVPAQRTQFKPMTMAMLLVAREQAGKAVIEALPALKADSDVPSAAAKLADAAGRVALVMALAQLAIVAWEGVGDEAGAPALPTSESIAAYMENWQVFDRVQALYVEPALAGIDEKNAFAPSRNGTSGARTRAKVTAVTAH